MMTRSYTESDAMFIQKFFGMIPTVKSLRDARWSLISPFPRGFTLEKCSKTWREHEKGRFILGSHESRGLTCARFELREALLSYLQSASRSDKWPKTPDFNFLSIENQTHTVAVELSLDTGGGTAKFMAKFLKQGGGQTVSDVILLAEAFGVRENFKEISTAFGCFNLQIQEIHDHGLNVEGVRYNVLFFS